MILEFDIDGGRYGADTGRAIDISIPLLFGGPQPNAFHLPRAEAHHAEGGDFIGDVRLGGSCNCETVTLNPHGSGTHTESVGHISSQRIGVRSQLVESLLPAILVTAEPEGTEGGDRVVSRRSLERALGAFGTIPSGFRRGLVVRTLPNDEMKKNAAWSGANPPYFSLDAMRFVRELNVEHLLVDLPSVDREEDGGALAAHRIFWDVEPGAREIPEPWSRRTITEMIFVESAVPDGRYLLDLQIPPWVLDAAPSRPLLYPVIEIRSDT